MSFNFLLLAKKRFNAASVVGWCLRVAEACVVVGSIFDIAMLTQRDEKPGNMWYIMLTLIR